MRPLLPLVALMLVLATAPAHAETAEVRRYVASPITIEECAPGCDLDGPGPLQSTSVGRMDFSVDGARSVLIVPQDDVTVDAPVVACFASVYGDLCTDEDSGSPPACGTALLAGGPYVSSILHVWVMNLLVDEDLAFCAGTTGTLTLTSF